MTERKVSEDAVTDFDAVEAEEGAPPPPDACVYLVVSQPGEAPRALDLPDGGEVFVGRTSDNAVSIDHARVSRRHARIARARDALVVEDLGSRNGTRIGARVLHGESSNAVGGEVVRVGPAEIVIAVVTPRAATAASSPEEEAPLGADDVVVADPEMRKVLAVARRLGRSQTTVLILGETGVGKEVIAERIHRASARASGPLVRLHCSSLPPSVIESELFGYERGAFTGAERRKIGYVEAANGGTLLLDEIGEISAQTQVKLLRVLEQRAVSRLGGTQEIPVDVRILSATHRDLEEEVRAGRFREDLFYRINTFTLRVPPLRDRPTEIPLLTALFTREVAAAIGVPPPRIHPEAARHLASHRWPGNVRELRNAIEHAVVLAEEGIVRAEHLPPAVRGEAPPGSQGSGRAAGSLRTEVASVERKNIEAALAAEGGNRTHAAARLGISRRALIYKVAKYRIER